MQERISCVIEFATGRYRGRGPLLQVCLSNLPSSGIADAIRSHRFIGWCRSASRARLNLSPGVIADAVRSCGCVWVVQERISCVIESALSVIADKVRSCGCINWCSR
jgi:hypothetical protein